MVRRFRASVARRLVLAGFAVLAARAAHRTAQELGLLMWRLEAVTTPSIAAAIRNRLRHAILRRSALFGWAVAITKPMTLAVASVVVAVAIAAVVATDGPVLAIVIAAPALWPPLLRPLPLRREWLGEAVIDRSVVAALVAEVVATVAHIAGPAYALTIAVHAIARLIELVAIGHDDAAIVLSVLQIILRQHGIAGCLRVTRQSDIFFGDVCWSAADFHVRAIGFKAARERIVVAFTIGVPATSAPILLSLPHCRLGSRLT